MTGLFQPLASGKKARCSQAEQRQVRLCRRSSLRRHLCSGLPGRRALGRLALGQCCILCRRGQARRRSGFIAFPIPEIANRRGESSPRALRSPPSLDVTTTHCARTPNHGEPVERSSSTNRRSATHGCVRVHARSSRKRRERDAGGCEERQLQLQARRRAANGRRGSRARAGLILAPPGCLR